LPLFLFTWRHSFDVMHSHLYYYQKFFKSRVKVVHFHTDPLYKGAAGVDISLKQEAVDIILQTSDAQVAVSKFVARQLRTCLGAKADIHVIQNAVDANRFEDVSAAKVRALHARYKLDSDQVVFLFAGAVVPEKGMLDLAKAFAQLCEDPSLKCHLLIAGSSNLWGASFSDENQHDSYEGQVRAALKKPMMTGRVSFLGMVAVQDMPPLYSAVDVVVMPSVWNEAFGLVALEACVSGKAVIGTSGGGLGELLRFTEQLVVPPKDVTALRDAMTKLAKDSEKRELLGQNAKVLAKRLSWEASASELDYLYRHLFKEKFLNYEFDPASV